MTLKPYALLASSGQLGGPSARWNLILMIHHLDEVWVGLITSHEYACPVLLLFLPSPVGNAYHVRCELNVPFIRIVSRNVFGFKVETLPAPCRVWIEALRRVGKLCQTQISASP